MCIWLMNSVCPLRKTFSHTRFRLSIRTVDAPTVYHRLLLFRVNKPTVDPAAQDKVGQGAADVAWTAPDLYCMEETCPHLGAPLSHAQLEDIEDSMAIGTTAGFLPVEADDQCVLGINMTLVCGLACLQAASADRCRSP